MQPYGYMYGNFEAEKEPIVVADMVGFDGRKVTITGYRDLASRVFFFGDSGPACHCQDHCGFQLQTIRRFIPAAHKEMTCA